MIVIIYCSLVACQTAPVSEVVRAGVQAPASAQAIATAPALAQAPALAPAPAPTQAPASATIDTSIEALLDRMEVQGNTMKDFSAQATVEKFEALTDEREVRRGRVVVLGPSGAAREIAIAFDEFIDSSGRGSTDTRQFIYRGGWLLEFDPSRKQLIRRQLAAEGESFDPLRVGDGPFPIPLGQPKKDIVREFIVTAGTMPDAPFFRSLKNASAQSDSLVILRLVPRAGTSMARETSAMTILFDRLSLVPQGLEIEAVNGDRTRVILRNTKLNAGLDDVTRAMLVAPSTDGWKIDSRPLK